jgi:hypothetical protein
MHRAARNARGREGGTSGQDTYGPNPIKGRPAGSEGLRTTHAHTIHARRGTCARHGDEQWRRWIVPSVRYQEGWVYVKRLFQCKRDRPGDFFPSGPSTAAGHVLGRSSSMHARHQRFPGWQRFFRIGSRPGATCICLDNLLYVMFALAPNRTLLCA